MVLQNGPFKSTLGKMELTNSFVFNDKLSLELQCRCLERVKSVYKILP